ncbi:MAG: putative C-S lyase [Leptolinea sp.]|jgi:cystathionine beta-lyase|nr:putative C-S lyase [Leptolinea sp.]
MPKSFDKIIDRRNSDSIKWNLYESDVLPMWVADMDFAAPAPVIQALRDRVEHGIFGYAGDPLELRKVIVDRFAERYQWTIKPEDIVFTPGVVVGFNIAGHAVSHPEGEILIQTPVYPPFFKTGSYAGLKTVENQLVPDDNGYYGIDFDDFEKKVTEKTRMFLLCNPHNPVGRVFRRDELERMAEICLQKNVLICSDEIHGDLIFDGYRHIPLGSLDPEIARKTITLMAPSKTFNIAGLDCSFAIITDKEIRDRYNAAMKGITGNTNMLGITAALAAYQSGQPWLEDLMAYLKENRDLLKTTIDREMPEIRMSVPEGTYLAWLDCRHIGLKENPYDFFLKKARIAFNNGESFGTGGKGFVRMNFGCTKTILLEALERMKNALRKKAG